MKLLHWIFSEQKYFTAVLFLAALALRIIFVTAIPHNPIYPDTFDYQNIAVNMSHGQGYSIEAGIPTARRMPVYPLFLAVIFFFFGSSNSFAVELIQCVIGALTCIVVYKISLQIFNEQISRIVFILTAFQPVLIAYCAAVLSECLFTFFLSLCVFLTIKSLKSDSLLQYFAAGAMLGVAGLTRPEAPSIIILIIIAIVFKYKFRSIVFYSTAFLLLGISIVYSPWCARNYNVFHYIFPGNSRGVGATAYTLSQYVNRPDTENTAAEIDRELAEIGKNKPVGERERDMTKQGMRVILKNPVKVMVFAVGRLPRFWFTSHSAMFSIMAPNSKYMAEKYYFPLAVKSALLLLQALLLCMTAIGLLISGVKKQGELLLFLLLLFPSLYVLVDISNRHQVPFLPFFLIFSGVALHKFVSILPCFNRKNIDAKSA